MVDSTKTHLQTIGLTILHEERLEKYWSIKAHKGGKLAAVTGSIRDVEILLVGEEDQYEITLRTGALGRDIVIPVLLASAVSLAGQLRLLQPKHIVLTSLKRIFGIGLNNKSQVLVTKIQ